MKIIKEMQLNELKENYKIDSLKIRIPIEYFDTSTLPPNIKQEVKSYTTDKDGNHDYNINDCGILEIKNEVPSKTKIYNIVEISNDGGITNMQYQVERSYIKHKKMVEVISFKVTAKHLKQRYFEGLTLDNIDGIVDYINTATDKDGNRLSITKTKLLNSLITDIDICKDTKFNDATFEELLNYIEIRCKTYKERGKGYRKFNDAGNKGIEFGERETATVEYPYLKFYSKSLDAISGKHYKFFEYYSIEVPSNIYRIEYTIKNKRHLDKFGIGNRLIDILQVGNDVFNTICKKTTDIHFNKTEKLINIDVKDYGSTTMTLINLLLEYKPIDITIEHLEAQIKVLLKRNTANRLINDIRIVHNRKIDANIDYRKNNEISHYFESIF